MLKKNISFETKEDNSLVFSLVGDLHSYSKKSLGNLRSSLNKYHPDLNFSIGDFPHLFYESNLQDFKYLDLAVPGNHEFYKSSQAFDEIRYSLPFVSVSSFEDSEQIFPSYRLFEVKGRKISVIGLNVFSKIEEVAKNPRFSILPFEKSLAKVAEFTEELKNRTDLFIYLSHCGLDNDVRLLEQIPLMTGIKKSKMLVLGGHNHIVNPISNKVLDSRILHSGTDMQYLGLVKVSFGTDNENKVSLLNIPLENKKKIAFDNKYPIHYVEENLGLDFINNDFFHVSPLGAMFTDKVRRDYEADVVIINSGGLRDILDHDYLQKDAKEIAYKILPFSENRFVIFHAYKYQIEHIIKKELAVLNKNIDSHAGKLGDKLFFQVSGLEYSFEKNKKGKYCLSKVFIDKNPKNKSRMGKNLYKVIMPNFLWNILGLVKIIGKENVWVGESVQASLERFLAGNSLKTMVANRYAIKRKKLKD